MENFSSQEECFVEPHALGNWMASVPKKIHLLLGSNVGVILFTKLSQVGSPFPKSQCSRKHRSRSQKQQDRTQLLITEMRASPRVWERETFCRCGPQEAAVFAEYIEGYQPPLSTINVDKIWEWICSKGWREQNSLTKAKISNHAVAWSSWGQEQHRPPEKGSAGLEMCKERGLHQLRTEMAPGHTLLRVSPGG